MKEQWGVCANVYGDRIFREGARVFVDFIPGDRDSAQVQGRSIGGRIVTKWVRLFKLADFRAKFCPSKHPWQQYDTKAEAQEIAERWAGCANFIRDERAEKQGRRLAKEAIKLPEGT